MLCPHLRRHQIESIVAVSIMIRIHWHLGEAGHRKKEMGGAYFFLELHKEWVGVGMQFALLPFPGAGLPFVPFLCGQDAIQLSYRCVALTANERSTVGLVLRVVIKNLGNGDTIASHTKKTSAAPICRFIYSASDSWQNLRCCFSRESLLFLRQMAFRHYWILIDQFPATQTRTPAKNRA